MSLKLKLATKELKNAITAGESMSKKIPNDITPGDAFAAFLRREDHISWVVVHDYFTIENVLTTCEEVGSDDEGIFIPWDGQSSINENNVLGIYGMGNLTGLLSKLGDVKEITINVDNKKRIMNIEADGGKEYSVDMAVPRKLIANYATTCKQKSKNTLVTFSDTEFAWFCSTIGDLGKVVKPSVSKPGFSNVIITAFPSNNKNMMLSGNSNDEGYSVIYNSFITADTDFTILMPKNLSEGFNTFLSKIGMPEGDVVMSGDIADNDENKSVQKLFFSNDNFQVSIVCKKDFFPFKAIDGIVEQANIPYCTYQTKHADFKKVIDRLAVFAKSDEAVSEITVLDGGTVELIQRLNIMSKEKPARELCDSGELVDYPPNTTSVNTSIKTDVIKSILGIIPKDVEMKLVLCEAQPNGSRRTAIKSADDNSEITAVMLGLRSNL